MNKRILDFPTKFRTGIVLCFSTVFIPVVNGATTKITPAVEVIGTYTDNVELSNSPISDYIFQIVPKLAVSSHGAHTDLEFSYIYDSVFYKDHSEKNTGFQQLDLVFAREIFDDVIFLDVLGNYEQQLTNELTNVGNETIVITENRTDVGIYNITPRINTAITRVAELELQSSYGVVDYRDVENSDSKNYQHKLVLKSADRGSITFARWFASGQTRKVVFETGAEVKFERFDLGITGPVLQRLSWSIDIGTEKNRLPTSTDGNDAEDDIWRVGIHWNPQNRTSISGGYGKRQFGDTYDLNVRHQGKYSVIYVSYNEDLQTTSLRQEAIRGEGTLGDTQLEPIRDENVSNETFILKRWDASFSRNVVKSTINMNFSKERRIIQPQGDLESMWGAGINFTWRFLPRTSMSLIFNRQREDVSIEQSYNDTKNIVVKLEKNVSQRIFASARIEHTERDSNIALQNYNSNIFMLKLSYSY